MEYPNIVRDSLNPHADMLRELKHKCKWLTRLESIFIFCVSVPTVQQVAPEKSDSQQDDQQHQQHDHDHQWTQTAPRLVQVT